MGPGIVMSVLASVNRITDEATLRELIGGEPTATVASKVVSRVGELTRRFVEASPFVCLATAHPEGGLDVSPRGDPAGFVQILDEQTLFLPERPGNRIADTLTNLLHDDRIALLFLIPGIGETFRVNGRAVITDEPELLEPCAVDGKIPKLGILVSIEQAYTQCPKALIRSDLWNSAHHIDRNTLPSSGEIMRWIKDGEFDAEGYDREREARYARGEGLY
jgi:uncharacterized protein